MSKCKIHGKDGYRVYSVVDGKKKYFYGYTQKEANAKKAEFDRKLQARINFDWEKATISHMIDEWLSENEDRWERSTYEWYVNMTKHIKRDIGSLKLWDVTARQLNSFLKALAKRNPNTGKPAGKKLVKSIKHILKTSFGWAVANNYLERDPTVALLLPKTSASNTSGSRCLELKEIQWILYTPHKMQMPSVIMLYTGMRPEEVLALKNSDINLEKGVIYVNKAVKYSRNAPYIGETKTGVNRVVVMPPELIEFLKGIGIESNDKLLVPDSDGKLYHKTNWQRKYKSYITDLDILYGGKFKSKFDPNYVQTIKGWTPYCLRHTSSTMGGLFGVNKKQLADNQGHDEETMTRYYEDSVIEARRKEIAKIAYKNILSKPEIVTPA